MNPFDLTLTRRAMGLASVMAAMFGRQLRAQPSHGAPEPAPLSPPRPSVRIELNVNGEPYDLSLDARTTLLDALRDHLGFTGTKKGCDHGQCGACTVLVNGVRMNSCLSLAVARGGDEIVTVEGLADHGRLHALQQAFIREDGFQCGYCTPGQLCSAIGMLDELEHGVPSAVTANLAIGPHATAEEIRERMSGNICRCSAYPNIVAAIMTVHQAQAVPSPPPGGPIP
jgi:xanthine dehydrogenase YagT iron-sulfur-binding subunit